MQLFSLDSCDELTELEELHLESSKLLRMHPTIFVGMDNVLVTTSKSGIYNKHHMQSFS